MAEKRIGGIGVSEGIRFGKALCYSPVSVEKQPAQENVSADQVENELNRLQSAKEASMQELDTLIERTKESLGEEKATILAGQKSFLTDPTFFPEMEKRVKEQLFTAEKAVLQVVDHFITIFENMPSDYLRERATDVKDVGRRLLSQFQGNNGVQLSEIKEEVILVADDLTPSDTVQLDKQYILGFITRIGGKTSHTAILSRSLGIPAIVGMGDDLNDIQNGDFLIIDGTTGMCIVNPDSSVVDEFRSKMEKEREQEELLHEFVSKPAITSDGYRIEIAANIGTPPEANIALENGAEGIGLYRTEFLFMNADKMPSEEEQYQAYKETVQIMGDKPVIFRTLDIGGDKELAYLSFPKEMNPFLGYRAIRLCLDQKEILVTQLRAILRASVHGKLKIMFPMISSLNEWRRAKTIYEGVQQQLKQEQVPFDESIELGIMVEIPSAAVLADLFAKEVDYFSIGTNDLVQYTLAVDRMNEKVAYLYDYFHPSVIRLIKGVIDAAHREGKWVGMCGGMAGDPLASPLLIGLELDEWSMASGSINKVKQVISQVDRQTCKNFVNDLLQLGTVEQIREELKNFSTKL